MKVGRESGAWYAVWLAMAESVRWLHAHYSAELAATVAGYMAHRGIWFRRAKLDLTGTDEASRGARLRRSEMLDHLLSEIDSQNPGVEEAKRERERKR